MFQELDDRSIAHFSALLKKEHEGAMTTLQGNEITCPKLLRAAQQRATLANKMQMDLLKLKALPKPPK